MTVQKDLVKNIYVGNGSTTQFPITFDVNAEQPGYIHVYISNDDNSTTETENYTVDLISKIVTYPKSGEPLASGKKLVIMRELPLMQLMDLINQGDYYADDVEQAFDDLTMIAQQLSEKLARAMVFSVEVDTANFSNIIPLAPGMSFRINDEGTGLELTEDPAKVLPQAQNLLQQTTQQANTATEKANAAAVSETNAAESESNAASSETNAAASEEMAQKWAESETSPDGEDDADSPTGDTMSAKEWALYAKEIAENMGNPVTDVDEENGTVTVTKSDGTQSSFKAGINILQRNKTYAVEDIAYSFGLPSWAYLECTEAGTTAATEPSFASATTPGTYVTDGTAEFILCDMRDGTPVGRVVYAETLQDGYLKYNGATVSRSDYKRPCRYATKKNLFYDADDTYTFMGTTAADSTTITGISAADIEKLQTAKQVCGDGILITGTGIADDCMIDTINEDSVTITVAATAAGTVKISYGNIHNYPYMYGIGDGTSTFVLPDYRGRFIMGGDNVQILNAGLPNITGGNGVGWENYRMFQIRETENTGAFKIIQRTGGAWQGYGDSGQSNIQGALGFDASRSNSIYGTSETVQPPAFSLIPQIKY